MFSRDHLHGRDRWLDVTVSPLVLQPGVVLRAPTAARSRDSWRRKLFREMLRRLR